MDDVFKRDYAEEVCFTIEQFEPLWEYQVVDMPKLWERVGAALDREHLITNFQKHCQQIDLPYETFDIEEAFRKVNGEWKDELMLDSATLIFKRSGGENNEFWYVIDEPLELRNGRIGIKDNIWRRHDK